MAQASPSLAVQLASMAWILKQVRPVIDLEAEQAVAEVMMASPPTFRDQVSWDRQLLDRILDGEVISGLELTAEACSSWNMRWAERTRVHLRPEDDFYRPIWQNKMKDEPEFLWSANLAFLLQRRGYGAVRELANRLEVREETVTRWKCWIPGGRKASMPRAKNRPVIANHFGVPSDVDLGQVPLFLGLIHRRLDAKRQSAKERIDRMKEESLDRLLHEIDGPIYRGAR